MINPLFFIIGFAVGMFFVYILAPIPKVAFRHVLQHTNDIYKHNNGKCYTFEKLRTKCGEGELP